MPRFLAHRHLLSNLYAREIRNRYVGSATGMIWALAHPLILLAVFGFVFTTVFRPPEISGKHYLLFVAIALWPWIAFQEGVLRGVVVIQGYAGLIKKVAFPHELLVYASVAATFSLHFAGYLIVLFALWILGEPVMLQGLPLAAALWAVLLAGTIGLTMVLTATQVFLKDVEHVLSPVMQILMYVAPILYPLALVPVALRPWVQANPMSYLVERLREALEAGQALPQWTDGAALLVALGLFALGRLFFLRLSPYFEDFV